MKFIIDYINQKGGSTPKNKPLPQSRIEMAGPSLLSLDTEGEPLPLEELENVYYIKCKSTEGNYTKNVCKQISKEELDKDEQNINLININITKIKDVTFPLIDEKDLDHFINLNSENKNEFNTILNEIKESSPITSNLYKKDNLNSIIQFILNSKIQLTKNNGTTFHRRLREFFVVRKKNGDIEIYDHLYKKYYNVKLFF